MPGSKISKPLFRIFGINNNLQFLICRHPWHKQSSASAMDPSEASERQFELGVEQVLAGHSVVYHGAVFSVSKKRELEICSYSDFHPENSTEEMMLGKINRSEAVLTELQI